MYLALFSYSLKCIEAYQAYLNVTKGKVAKEVRIVSEFNSYPKVDLQNTPLS